MKINMKMSYMVCLVLLFLSGCGYKENSIEQPQLQIWSTGWQKETKVIYKDDAEKLNSIRVNNGNIVYSVTSFDEEIFYIQDLKTSSEKLLYMNNREITDVLDYWLDEEGNSFFIVLEATTEGEYVDLWKCSADGKKETLKRLNDFHRGNNDDCYDWKVRIKQNGNILIYSRLAYLVLDEVGNTVREGSLENNMFYDVAYFGEDSLFLRQFENYIDSFSTVDLNTGRSKKLNNLPASTRFDFMKYSDSGIFMYTDSECYCYNLQTEQVKTLFKWADYGIVGDNICCVYAQDGDVHCILYENCVLYDVTYKKTELVTPKAEIVLGCIGESTQLRRAVVDFNNNNSNCIITIRDYWEEDTEVAVNNMYNAILAGDGPDIIGFEPRYANDIVLGKSGMLEDLNVYLNESQVIGPDDIVNSIYQELLTENKLYMLPTNFTLDTLITKKTWVDEIDKWACEDLLKLLKSNPKLDVGVNKDTMLECGALYGLNSVEEYENMQDIIGGYMQISYYLPSDVVYNSDEAARRQGQILFEQCMIDCVDTYLYKKSVWGDDSIFMGFPDVKGNGMAIIPVNCFGINAKSEHKKEAWKFIESFFTEGWKQKITPNWCFSVCKDTLKEQFEDAISVEYYYDRDNNRLEVPIMSYTLAGESIDVYAGKEDIEKLRWMIENASVLRRENASMINIMQEEATYYFAGVKELEQVRDIISNRIILLLDE